MIGYRASRHSNRTHESRLVLLVLLLAILPTAGLLWFISIAARNESLASRQRLIDAYRPTAQRLADLMADRLRQLADSDDWNRDPRAAPAAFQHFVMTAQADAAILRTSVPDVVAYPTNRFPAASLTFDSESSRRALQQESASAFADAANRWADLANVDLAETVTLRNDSPTQLDNRRANAYVGMVRCLLKSGEFGLALDAAEQILEVQNLREFAFDDHSLWSVNVLSQVVTSLAQGDGSDSARARIAALATKLATMLNDYQTVTMPSTQRLFLMKRLTERFPGTRFPTLEAEQLTMAIHNDRFESGGGLRRLPERQLWYLASPDGFVQLVYRTETLQRVFQQLIPDETFTGGVAAELVAPEQEEHRSQVLLLSESIQAGWRVAIVEQAGSNSSVSAHAAAYGWLAILITGAIAALAVYVVRSFRQTMFLAKLKNDLVGTVSHELRTPLASMRMLVDTLLDTTEPSPSQTREYLQLVAKENTRLSTLVENFLTFSRFERGRDGFEYTSCNAADVVQRAIEAGGDRLQGEDCQLSVNVEVELPPMHADEGAIVIAILNLVDNAYKYSEPIRKIELTAKRLGDSIQFAVSDNGIGMAAKVSQRIFQQFYQADPRLSRGNAGCGLGLSIVKSIVDRHRGSICVESELGVGSRFVVQLPIVAGDQAGI